MELLIEQIYWDDNILRDTLDAHSKRFIALMGNDLRWVYGGIHLFPRFEDQTVSSWPFYLSRKIYQIPTQKVKYLGGQDNW